MLFLIFEPSEILRRLFVCGLLQEKVHVASIVKAHQTFGGLSVILLALLPFQDLSD